MDTAAHRTLVSIGFGLALLSPLGVPGALGWGAAHAETPTPATELRPKLLSKSDATTGTLLFESTTPGRYLAAPTVGTDVLIEVSGPVARTTLVQTFTNPTDQWVEGIYVFPLPDTAAVDSLKLKVGDRLIEGTIQEKRKAREIYEAAKAAGHTAALTEQDQPNLFTNAVANIGPGETVSIRLTYQETVEMEADGFSLRFPMTTTPRYAPTAPVVQTVSLDGSGFASDIHTVAAKTHAIVEGPINPVTLRVDLDAGFPVGGFDSPSHELTWIETETGQYDITIDTYADRDFVLEWEPEGGPTPSAGLFTETLSGTDYHLLMLTPPTEGVLDLPRDVTFILDVSGSMAGESLQQAKTGLRRGLSSLGAGDRFNIIAFDDRTYAMWSGLRDASRENLQAADRWLARQSGGGGTEMLPALRTALSQQSDARDRLAQILFLTDGAISNEDALFETIAEQRGTARVFTIGMGSAPNTHFMRRAAELGRGSHTHIGNISEAAARMDDLAAKLERPVMTDIELAWPDGTGAKAWPNPVPDLYAGETLHITAGLPTGTTGEVRVVGLRAGEPFEAVLPLGQGASRPGVSKLWAREKIAALELRRLTDYGRQDEIDADILETALDFSLVTRLTSLVAVDVTPRRPDGEPLLTAQAPNMAPKGWDFDAQWRARDMEAIDYGDLIAPSDGPRSFGGGPDRTEIDIPRGSTPALLNLLLGLLTLFVTFLASIRDRTRGEVV